MLSYGQFSVLQFTPYATRFTFLWNIFCDLKGKQFINRAVLSFVSLRFVVVYFCHLTFFVAGPLVFMLQVSAASRHSHSCLVCGALWRFWVCICSAVSANLVCDNGKERNVWPLFQGITLLFMWFYSSFLIVFSLVHDISVYGYCNSIFIMWKVLCNVIPFYLLFVTLCVHFITNPTTGFQ